MKFTKELFNEIQKSEASQKLLIVPAQLTLSAEAAAFDMLKKEGFFDLQIMSGNKLRAEIISKTGGSGKTAITSLGRNMILRKCARESKLSLYQNFTNSSEFLSAAGDFLLQVKQTQSEGFEIPNDAPELLKEKLSDMSKLKTAYETYMSGKYMDSEDGLSFATSQVSKCDWIKQSEIWFAGFYSFTKNEKAFLSALNENSFGCHVVPLNIKEEFPQTLQAVIATDSSYKEAIKIAAEILRLIREEKYKAEDIMILSANILNDGPNFKRIFESLNIPVYLDEKKSIMHISAAAKIVNLLDIAADGCAPHLVMQFVDDPDFTNYVKSYHIKKDAFFTNFKYGGEKKKNAEIARDDFARLTEDFFKDFSEAKTGEAKSRVLYKFLVEDFKLPEKLEADIQNLSDAGYIEASEELAQAWSVIVEILDQLVELLGDEELSNSEYRDIIKNAFKDVKIGLLPQTSGCIIIGDLYRTKANKVKALFISSFVDGCVPRNLNASAILTDEEIGKLYSAGINLCKDYNQIAKEDKTILYEAFETPSEKLYFTYSNSDTEGKEQSPSYLISDLPKQENTPDIFTLEELINKLRNLKSDGIELDEKWKTAANKFSQSERYKAIVSGLLYKNEDEKLSKDVCKEILKSDVVSPSALEKYALCPYSYFVKYGLKAEEIEDFSLKANNIGDIHHDVLQRLANHLSNSSEKVSDASSLWQTISEKEIKDFVSKEIDNIREEDTTGLFKKSFAEQYRIDKLKALSTRFASRMIEQVRQGNIDKIEAEKRFDFTFKGTKIYGKIDRLDTTQLSTETLVKVIDYKSGVTEFNKDLIEKGLSLQLMLYLESATQGGAKPIGSFYFHIADPSAEIDIAHLELGEIDEKIAEKISEQYRLDGPFVSNPDEMAALDKRLKENESSTVVNVKKALTANEYEELREKFRESLTRTIADLQAGKISIDPKYTVNKDTSCKYCSYRSVCKFDPQIEAFIVRRL